MTLDDVRGGSALGAASRFNIGLVRVGDRQITQLSLGESHRAEAEEVHWEIYERPMRNGTVGVLVEFEPESVMDQFGGVTEVAKAIRKAADAPHLQRREGQTAAGDTWFGCGLAKALGQDIGPKGKRSPKQKAQAHGIAQLITACESQELLTRVEAQDAKRNPIHVFAEGPKLGAAQSAQ